MNDVDINEVADIFLEFVEVVSHNVIYHMKIYPEGIFNLKKKYGVPVHISMHPGLNQYISQTLIAAKTLFLARNLKQIDLCFFSPSSIPVEKIVFYLESVGLNERADTDTYFVRLREDFRSLCLKMTVRLRMATPLLEGSTFKFIVHSCESDFVNFLDSAVSQGFPFIELTDEEAAIPESEIIAVQTINHDLFTAHVFLEKNRPTRDSL